MGTLRVDTLADGVGSGPATLVGQNAAKIWFNYNQVANTLKDSINISTVTDTGAGNFTLNYTNNMADVNYAMISIPATTGTVGVNSTTIPANIGTNYLTSATRLHAHLGTTLTDLSQNTGGVFGELA